jgi:UDP-N-acetylglucosamine/UDP-N-acetylgalactosamine 4-epimerase
VLATLTPETGFVSETRYDKLRDELQKAPRVWLVTGAAGFIGSHLVEELLRLGQRVKGLDNFATGKPGNLDEVRQRFNFSAGDICDAGCCRQACDGVDYVLHQAALGSVPRSLADPQSSHQTNVDGFVNMVIAARDAKVKRFVYASSSSVYGDHPALPKVESNVGAPLSPYAATKATNEVYANVFSRCYSLPTVGLRYFNVFGPRQDPNGAYAAVIPLWFKALLNGGEIVVNGDGLTSRDFCFVANVVQANLLAAGALADARACVLNVAVGRRTTLLGLIEALKEAIGRLGPVPAAKVLHRLERDGDVKHSLADISRAVALIGYQPTHTLEQGLVESSTWYVRNSAVSSQLGLAR